MRSSSCSGPRRRCWLWVEKHMSKNVVWRYDRLCGLIRPILEHRLTQTRTITSEGGLWSQTETTDGESTWELINKVSALMNGLATLHLDDCVKHGADRWSQEV